MGCFSLSVPRYSPCLIHRGAFCSVGQVPCQRHVPCTVIARYLGATLKVLGAVLTRLPCCHEGRLEQANLLHSKAISPRAAQGKFERLEESSHMSPSNVHCGQEEMTGTTLATTLAVSSSWAARTWRYWPSSTSNGISGCVAACGSIMTVTEERQVPSR